MKKIVQTQFEPIAPSELVLNGDGSVYHLALRPDQIADSLIVVGDPGRVKRISRHFDRLEHKVENREFLTHTGTIGSTRISVLSTGIGVDNIDIVMNELDALRNIDLHTRKPLDVSNPLRIVRLGTSGALNADLAPGSVVHSRYAIGLDGVLHFYKASFESDELALARDFAIHTGWDISDIKPYAVRSDDALGALFGDGFYQGITVTACGFYGPQGRILRLPLAMVGLNDRMADFKFGALSIANYEMESSALFGLGTMLGHACTTVCVVVANRIRNEFLTDHHPAVDGLITRVLERLTHH